MKVKVNKITVHNNLPIYTLEDLENGNITIPLKNRIPDLIETIPDLTIQELTNILREEGYDKISISRFLAIDVMKGGKIRNKLV